MGGTATIVSTLPIYCVFHLLYCVIQVRAKPNNQTQNDHGAVGCRIIDGHICFASPLGNRLGNLLRVLPCPFDIENSLQSDGKGSVKTGREW